MPPKHHPSFQILADFLMGECSPGTALLVSILMPTLGRARYVAMRTKCLSNVRQQVLALDAWTSYSPTWHQHGEPGHLNISTAPPFYNGAQLGGMSRMRGFPEERFHDRAGVYACAELRLIPYWNPLREITLKHQTLTFQASGRSTIRQ